MKILVIVLTIILAVLLILILASLTNHKVQLTKEAQAYPPMGKIVEVNQKKLHVYAAGSGDRTLVFLSGHGTTSPTLDFKPLWSQMSDEYRIAVVEKSGYGWSETSNHPRDLDTMLEETRKALRLAGEQAPYILIPHSMSGLEALYWAQRYPEEVEAIVGLDLLVPQSVDTLPMPPKFQLHMMYVISRVGLSRFMPESEIEKNFPLLKSDILSDGEKAQYVALFYRNALSKDMLKEMEHLGGNAEMVEKLDVPSEIPMYFFISEEQESIAPGWHKALSDYLSHFTQGKSKLLSTNHYVHHENADIIAEEMRIFLSNLENDNH